MRVPMNVCLVLASVACTLFSSIQNVHAYTGGSLLTDFNKEGTVRFSRKFDCGNFPKQTEEFFPVYKVSYEKVTQLKDDQISVIQMDGSEIYKYVYNSKNPKDITIVFKGALSPHQMALFINSMDNRYSQKRDSLRLHLKFTKANGIQYEKRNPNYQPKKALGFRQRLFKTTP